MVNCPICGEEKPFSWQCETCRKFCCSDCCIKWWSTSEETCIMCRSVATVGAGIAIVIPSVVTLIDSVVHADDSEDDTEDDDTVDEEYERERGIPEDRVVYNGQVVTDIVIANSILANYKFDLDAARAVKDDLESKLLEKGEALGMLEYIKSGWYDRCMHVHANTIDLSAEFNELNGILTDTVSQFKLTSKRDELEIVSLQRQIRKEKKKSCYPRKSIRPSIRKESAVSRIFKFVRCSLFGK